VLKPALSSTNGHWRRNPATRQHTNLLAHPGRADLTVLAPFPSWSLASTVAASAATRKNGRTPGGLSGEIA